MVLLLGLWMVWYLCGGIRLLVELGLVWIELIGWKCYWLFLLVRCLYCIIFSVLFYMFLMYYML